MTMGPRLRKLVLAVHLSVSIAWVGAIAAYLPFDVVTASTADAASLRTAYLAMDLIASRVIVPLAVAALLTGFVVSAGTRWGLLRHWWVVISLLLTTLATVVLLVETRTIASLAAVAADPATSAEELGALGSTLLHSLGGMAILLVVLVLNVYKPRGLTRYGWRRQQAELRPAGARQLEDST